MKQLFVKERNCLKKIDLNEIYYFSTVGNKIIAFTIDSSIELAVSSLNYLNELLSNNSSNFFRCHKSFIINLNKIDCISKFNNKTYNISFRDIKNQVYITQKNLKNLKEKISLI